jgi:hypothetical protein
MDDKPNIVDIGERLEAQACAGESPVPVLRAAARWAKERKATLAAVVVIAGDDTMRFLSEAHGDDRLFVELTLMLDDVKAAIRDQQTEE